MFPQRPGVFDGTKDLRQVLDLDSTEALVRMRGPQLTGLCRGFPPVEKHSSSASPHPTSRFALASRRGGTLRYPACRAVVWNVVSDLQFHRFPPSNRITMAAKLSRIQ